MWKVWDLVQCFVCVKENVSGVVGGRILANRKTSDIISDLSFPQTNTTHMRGFFWESQRSELLKLRIPSKAAEMTFSIAVRGCSVSPGRGIMSTILTLNYSNSCCSCCLRTTLRIKHKDQARIRRKPLTSAEPPLCCRSAHARTAPLKSHTKLSLSPCNM